LVLWEGGKKTWEPLDSFVFGDHVNNEWKLFEERTPYRKRKKKPSDADNYTEKKIIDECYNSETKKKEKVLARGPKKILQRIIQGVLIEKKKRITGK